MTMLEKLGQPDEILKVNIPLPSAVILKIKSFSARKRCSQEDFLSALICKSLSGWKLNNEDHIEDINPSHKSNANKKKEVKYE